MSCFNSRRGHPVHTSPTQEGEALGKRPCWVTGCVHLNVSEYCQVFLLDVVTSESPTAPGHRQGRWLYPALADSIKVPKVAPLLRQPRVVRAPLPHRSAASGYSARPRPQATCPDGTWLRRTEGWGVAASRMLSRPRGLCPQNTCCHVDT